MPYPQPPKPNGFDSDDEEVSEGSYHNNPSQIGLGGLPVDPSLPPQRSYSTPEGTSVGSHGQTSQNEDSRRRNRLGYQRTSVACNNCRHRKIRCIPSPDEVESRCEPCIRLKKDCSFMNSEQPDSDGPARAIVRQQTGHRSSSSSSPTSMGVDPSQTSQRRYPLLPSDMAHVRPPMTGMPGQEGSFNSRSMPGSSATPHYDFAPNVSGWMNQNMNHSMNHNMSQNMSHSMSPNMNANMNPSMNPNLNPGMNPYLEPGNAGGAGWNTTWAGPQIDPNLTDPNLMNQGAPPWGGVPGASNGPAWGGMPPSERSMSYSSEGPSGSPYTPIITSDHPPPGFGGDAVSSGGFAMDPNNAAGMPTSQMPWDQQQIIMGDPQGAYGGEWGQPDGQIMVTQAGTPGATTSRSQVPGQDPEQPDEQGDAAQAPNRRQ